MITNSILGKYFRTDIVPKNISTIILGGSQIYAPDKFSDIDIGVVWRKNPTLHERERLTKCFSELNIINMKLSKPGHPDLGRSDNIKCAGHKVDLIHITTKQIEQCKIVLKRTTGLHLHYQALFWNLNNGLYIYGNPLPKFSYPKSLQSLIIRTQGPQIYPEDLALAISRNDKFFYNSTLVQIQRAEFLIFLARNKEFFVSFKQIDKQIERLKKVKNLSFKSNFDTRNYKFLN